MAARKKTTAKSTAKKTTARSTTKKTARKPAKPTARKRAASKAPAETTDRPLPPGWQREADAIEVAIEYDSDRDAVMSSARKRAARANNGADPAPTSDDSTCMLAPGESDDDVVVFAFRLTRAEREAIHDAAGSAKASKFVRAVALAAARGDERAFRQEIKEARERQQKREQQERQHKL